MTAPTDLIERLEGASVVEFRYAGSVLWRKAGIDGWRVTNAMRAGATFDARLNDGTEIHVSPKFKRPAR